LPYLKREELLMATSDLGDIPANGNKEADALKRILSYWHDHGKRFDSFSEEEKAIFRRLQEENPVD